jgi:hypothetical protein
MSTTLELYEKLKPKLGDTEARSLIEFIESSVERRAATKEDLALMEERLKREMVEMRREFDTKLAEVKSDLIKWSFAFWIGNVAVVIGIVLTLLRTMK